MRLIENYNMNSIFVNATAARSGGALSILNQFIIHINPNDRNLYCIFVDTDYVEIKHYPNIQYIHVDTRSWRKRIVWDEFGCKKQINKLGVNPSLIISFQNMGVKYDKDIPQLIYYHQSLLLFPKKWSFFKKQERLFFLYKHIYSQFVSRSIHPNVSFVVQIPSIKEAFLKRFPVRTERVYVIPPEIQTIDYNEISVIEFIDGKKHFIYPATPHLYKNHVLLLHALRLIKQKNNHLFSQIRLHVTLQENNDIHLKEQADKLGVNDAIVYEGVIPFEQLLSYYKSMHALLFPSYIETFGLPLLEAAGVGIPIVASDLPYVHDVIGEYAGVFYCDYQDAEAWASAIEMICKGEKKNYLPFRYPSEKGNWDDFFALIERLKIKD